MATLILGDKAENSVRAIELLSAVEEPTVVIVDGRTIGTFMPYREFDPERYRPGQFKDQFTIHGDLNEPLDVEWEVLKD